MRIIRIIGIVILAAVLAACNSNNSGDEDENYNAELTAQRAENADEAEHAERAETEQTAPDAADNEFQPIAYIERGWLATPYLVRLLPYRDGNYTDGMNVFRFSDSGDVYVRMYQGGEFVLTTQKMPPQQEYDAEEISRLGLIAAYNLEMGFWVIEYLDYTRHLVHVEGDTHFFHFTSPGGGSGEAFWARDFTFFGSVSADGHFTDLGVGAEHIVWHNGHFYFLDMVDAFVYWTPGIGTIGRMDMDGSNRITIVDSLTVGPFQILHDRILFSCLDSGLAYSTDLLGNDRRVISERIAPRYHRILMEIYGSAVINRAWMAAGYGMGIIVTPSDWSNPAIMCFYGGCLITFPHELRGQDPFAVLAYGYANAERSSQNNFFVVFRSNIDGSLWVYQRNCNHHDAGLGARVIFSGAREQLDNQR